MKYTESEKSLHGVLQELWYNIPSGTITSLRADNRLPSTDPDVVNILPQFDALFNFHTKYGQRLTGYLQVRSCNIIFFYKIWSHIMLKNELRCCTKRGTDFRPRILLNPRTYTQIHTPAVVQEGWGVDETPPRSF